MVATRQFQPMGLGNVQTIHDIRWATRAFAAGVIAATTNFFGAAPNPDLSVDRYESGNNLVGSGNIYTIYQIGVQLQAGAAATFADLESIINLCSIRLVTNSKEYGVFPIYMLPQGGGIFAPSQVAVTPAAAPGGAAATPGLQNGVPDRRAMFRLAVPLDIQANQSFYAEMLAPSGAGIVPAVTLTGAVRVRLLLDGQLQRTAS
jgi:hypothetical protein